MRYPRTAIAGLTLSAAALVGIFTREGYTDNTIIPVKGDRPTNGFGNTFKEDGSAVKLGEVTNPVKAAQRSLIHIQRDEGVIKQCVTAPLYQAEYDNWVNFSYNVGAYNFCTGGKKGGTSKIVQRLNAGDYAGACEGILDWKRSGGYDCSIPGNKVCSGLWKDRLESYKTCKAAL